MFKIKVTNLDDSYEFRKNWATKTVGLIDPERSTKGNSNYHVEFFHDVNYESNYHVYPKMEHFKRIMDFTKSLTLNDQFLVHCHQGISRSTAIMIAVLIQHGCSIKQAIDHVYSVRNSMWPNDLICKHADEYFNLQGKLIKEVNDYKEQWKNRFIIPDNQVCQDDIDFMKNMLDKLN